MKLYVIGGSGAVGKHVVEQALRRGHDVTVHARNASKLSVPERVQIVRRELQSNGAFEKLPGHDAVLSCVGNRRAGPSPYAKLRSAKDLCENMAMHLVHAMAESGVKRVVAISAAGVGDSKKNLNLVMQWLLLTSKIGVAYKDLEAMENVFAQTSLDWFCVRPVTLTDTKGTGKISVVDKFATTAKIARADVAKFMIDRVEERWPFVAHTQQIANAP